MGQARYSVRIQADPAALAARQMSLVDLANAAATTNINEASGNGATRTAIIRADGQWANAQQFRD
jgi:multidrug efflux pump subunit AcrB